MFGGAVMLARDWFDKLRGDVLDVASMEENVARLRGSVGPSGAASGSGGVRGGDGCPVCDRLIDAELELEQAKASLKPDLDRACAVLYGLDGRGGIARVRGSAAADSIHGYYLQGMSWPEVAVSLVRHCGKNGAHWCRMTAARALEYADTVGMETLMHL